MKCEICGRECDGYIGLASHLSNFHKIRSKDYYDQYLKKDGEGICPICDKETTYTNLKKGYNKFCSNKCKNSSEITINKIKQTNLKKYGVEHVSQREDIKERKRIKSIEKYGTEYAFQSEEIKDKIKETNLKNLGVEYPMQSNDIKEKCKNTCKEKYGVDNIFQYQDVKLKILKDKNDKMLIKILKFLDNNDMELHSEYNGEFDDLKLKCTTCGNYFINKWNNVQSGSSCPYCNKQRWSKDEKEIVDFIKSFNLEIIENSRNIIPPYELDIYIPDKSIAIEYNGLYYHSERYIKDKFYHLNKTLECLYKNIQLIHIFEDEWIYKKDIVKSRLKNILNLNNNLIKIYARNCIIKEIDSKVKNEFLNLYHIQGEDKSNIKLGAFYNDELISVMTFSKSNISRSFYMKYGMWELSRFCSNYNYHIPGIASKLLTHFKRNYKWNEIFSYADRRWSQGNLYLKLGFDLESFTKPNYWYEKNQNRIHRFNLRKKINEPKDIPEYILRENEGYYRIWDCGHYKFIIKQSKI